MSRKKPENLSFEEALDELETLVEQLEKGELSLEASLRTFERGVALTRSCQEQLQQAEQKVKILSEQSLQQIAPTATQDNEQFSLLNEESEDDIPF